MVKQYLIDSKYIVEGWLETLLVSPNEEYKKLYEAMNYSLLQGEKRIRHILTKAVLESLGATVEPYKEYVCAMECIHTYSLIHDDLPAMDNDDYRRGNLTNHKVYGDGMAILAGDGLLSYAFQLAAQNKNATPEQAVKAISIIATAAGPEGMVGGQAFDLQSEGKHLPLQELQVLHKGKTGALFAASVELGLVLGHADQKSYEAYMTYANALGLLFQITDDILDITGTIEELGKTPGSDLKLDKSTYVSLLGLDGARQEAQRVADTAKQALLSTNHSTDILIGLIDYLLERSN